MADKRIVVLSGRVCSGKSQLSELLIERQSFYRIKTRELLRKALATVPERKALQDAGERLDQESGGRWVADALARELGALPSQTDLVIDSIRIEAQLNFIREAFGRRVVHVHLTAPIGVLAGRYAQRPPELKELSTYEEVRASRTEEGVDQLAHVADVVIDTNRTSAEDVFVRIASHLGLYGRSVERLVDVLVGGQYGSEGKGNVCSYVAGEYDVLVRVGGPNAGHKVYAEPHPLTFRHLPSGTAHSEAKLVLGPGAVLGLETLLGEINTFEVTPERLSIDPGAMVIETADVEAEGRLVAGIGSTGQGVGFATSRKVLRTSATPPVRLASDVKELQPYLEESLALLEDAYSKGKKVFLEGTQGTGLSLHHGEYPFVTSRETTVSGCLGEAGIAPSRVRKIIMVCRTYPIRVESPKGGTSGPMGREVDWQVVADRCGQSVEDLMKAEKTTTTKRQRRVAEFDWSLLRRGASLNGPTDVALTFVDYLASQNQNARRFDQLTDDTIRFIEEVEKVAGAPVSMVSTRFHHRCIIDRRAW